jgi:hypothetical protein
MFATYKNLMNLELKKRKFRIEIDTSERCGGETKVQAANLEEDVETVLNCCLITPWLGLPLQSRFISFAVVNPCAERNSKGYNLQCTCISEQGSGFLGIFKPVIHLYRCVLYTEDL